MQTVPDWTSHDITLIQPFRGPGFYLSPTDTVLVTPLRPDDDATADNVWEQAQPDGTRWRLDVYSVVFAQTIFAACSTAPVRSDTRKS